MKTLKLSIQCALLAISSVASANWCTGKDFYLIEMELADRLIKGQDSIREQQKAIHRAQLQLQYDDTTPAESLKLQLQSSIKQLQQSTKKQCKQSTPKHTDLRLKITQLIHYKQLYNNLHSVLEEHKTIGKQLSHANDELHIAHTALQAPNQSLSKVSSTINAACLSVKYSQKVVERFQPIDAIAIKDSQHSVEDLQIVMDKYQLLSLPSNSLCNSLATFNIKEEDDNNNTSWWQKTKQSVGKLF